MRRSLSMLVVLPAVTLAAVVLPALAAEAAAPTAAVRIENQKTGGCLDEWETGGVNIWPAGFDLGSCTGGSGEFQWTFKYLGSTGHYHIVNKRTGRCLDSNAHGSVYTNPCSTGNDYQNWVLAVSNTKMYDDATVRCLGTDTKFDAQTQPCSTSTYQNWYLAP